MPELHDTDRFLAECWQKAPEFQPAALARDLPQLSPEELAWLATLPDVESRLVFTDHHGTDAHYRVENGPFTAAELSELPGANWTLLVQDVDKHLPDFRRYLAQAHFVPDWRIDDLMVSCAAPGGSVGPHVDNYDVFLCQGEGSREWQLGFAGQAEFDPDSTGLSLVKPFKPANQHRAEFGDVLYLPPGVPHWGVARDLCTTYSIGCRAPTRRELLLGQERVLGIPDTRASVLDDQVFYVDPDLSSGESRPGCIDPKTVARIREQQLLDTSLKDIELARVFGCVVTDPKAWLAPEPSDKHSIFKRLEETTGVGVHGMARICWVITDQERRVFVNGADRAIDAAELQIVQNLCARRHLAGSPAAVRELRRSHAALIEWLAAEGLFDTGHNEE